MKVATALIVIVVCAAVAGPKGTVPRGDASRYPAHATQVGALLLPPEQIKNIFVSDLGRCCVVVEVALYPEDRGPLEVSLGDFALRLAGADTATKPSSAKVVAASLQKANASDRVVTISPQVGIGYESGRPYYDPVTGERRGGGVRTSAGVGVGVGQTPPAASTTRDRDVMELELGEKGLPEGDASAPVAGYLYFAIAPKKKVSTYQLEYLLRGSKVVLRLVP